MIAAGHSVHVTAPSIPDTVRSALTCLGARCHEVPLSRSGLNPIADFRYYHSLREIIRSSRADLVIGYTIKPCIWGSIAARAEKVESASLVTGLGYAFIEGDGTLRKAIAATSRRLYRFATSANRVVIFQNPDDRDDFIAAGALADAGKARLVSGSGVDMDHYAASELPPTAEFLMIARLLGNKGVREYAEAATALIADGIDARFRLAGFFDEGPDGIDPAELDEWVAGGLDYLGPLDDVRPAIADASVYVLPSYREGTPRTVLEAMAMGRAVITSDAPGCRETVLDGKTGLLVQPRSPADLGKAMLRLANDGALRSAMGAAGLAYCRDRYAVAHVNAAMIDHLRL
jgi:glycosyltransferase involved in cell wall biosynthesis